MRNYKYLLLGIMIFLLIPILGFGQTKVEEENLLMGILEELDADFVEEDTDIGGTIINEFITKDEILIIGSRIREELSITGHKNVDEYYFEEFTQEEGYVQLIIQGIDKDDNLITFTLSSYDNSEQGSGETSLFVNILKRMQFVQINDIIKKVEKIFYEYDEPINITNCIVGTFDGEIELDKMEKRILKTAKHIKGKVIEKYNEDGVLSLSIYTPYIEEYIYTGTKKMNLNIGLRFNEYENKTYIWIGTPIITIGY